MRRSRRPSFARIATAIVAKVVDASALACICFDEPDAAATARQLAGAPLFAPALLDYEMANLCCVRLRRAPEASDATLRQYAKRHAFPITRRDVVFDEVLALATRTNLAVYDASYLWLTAHLGAALVTRDDRLARAARNAGMTLG